MGSAAEPNNKHPPPAKSQDLSVGHDAPVVPAVVPTKSTTTGESAPPLVPLIHEGDAEGRGSAEEPDNKHPPPAKSQDLSVVGSNI